MVAIWLVILTHVIEHSGIADYTRILRPLLYSIDRVGVPIFLMCMGALSVSYKGEIPFEKIFKRFLQLSVILVSFSILTNAIYLLIDGKPLYNAIALSIRWSNVVLHGSAGYAIHLWYLIMFLPLYLLTPFLIKMISLCSEKEAKIFLALCFVFGPISSVIFSITGKNLLSEMSSHFTGTYVFYVLAGHLIFHNNLLNKEPKQAKRTGIILFLAGITSTVTLLALWPSLSDPLLWYSTSPTIAISSIGAFLFIVSAFKNKEVRTAEYFSSNSFGAYLSHFALILIASYLIKAFAPETSSSIKALLLLLAASISFPLTWALRKNRVANYFVS